MKCPCTSSVDVNVSPIVCELPKTFTVVLHGGTVVVPLISPWGGARPVSSAVPVNSEPDGNAIAWASFLGVNEPVSTRFSGMGENANAGAAATDIAPTAATVAASAA